MFLSISYFDCRVSEALDQESQPSSCVEERTLLASCVVHGVTGDLLSCISILRLFPGE